METKFLDIVLNGIAWWIVITVLLIIIVVLGVRLLGRYLKHKEVPRKHLDLILYLGGLALLTGILAQVTGFISALNAIIRAADISFALAISGLKISFYLPCYGLIVSGFSLLAVTILRWRAGKPDA